MITVVRRREYVTWAHWRSEHFLESHPDIDYDTTPLPGFQRIGESYAKDIFKEKK